MFITEFGHLEDMQIDIGIKHLVPQPFDDQRFP